MRNIFKVIKPFLVKHQPEILMSMGIGGMIFSTIWSVKATSKAKDIVETQRNIRVLNGEYNDFTKKEIVKLTWKLYIPVVAGMAISIPCIVMGNRISNKRNLALAAAYTISETALQEYQDKTKEIVGEKKYEKIQESVSQELISKNPGNSVIMMNDGDSLFFEPYSGRYFKSNWNDISKAANELNAMALGNLSGITTLGDWYSVLGLDATELDNELGWAVVDGQAGIIDIKIDAVLTNEGKPCGAIRYNTRPKKI